jgi:hypothetical protein
MSPVLVVKLAEHSGAASAPWVMAGNETASGPWSAPVGHCKPDAADNPSSIPNRLLSSFSTKKTRLSTARSKASAGVADAGGTKGPYICDGEVRVIGESLTTPDKIRNLQRKTVIYTKNRKSGMDGPLLRFSPLDGLPSLAALK